MSAPPATLVLGLGNILLSDEGVGVRVVEALQARGRCPEGVELLDGGTSGMDLLDQLSGRTRVIVVDALAGDEAPGTVLRLEGDDLEHGLHTRMSPHEVGLPDVLAFLRLLGEPPAHLVLYGIVPESLELGLDLTSYVARGRDRVVHEIEAELEALPPSRLLVP